MAGFLQELLTGYQQQLERHRNRPFLCGAMAACALAASANGAITFGERIRVDQVLATLERLKIFDPHEGVDLFNEYSTEIFQSPRTGREEALAAVHKVSGDPEVASLLVRICLAVSETQAEPELVAQIEVVMLCSLLGVEPNLTGLYTDGGTPGSALGLQ